MTPDDHLRMARSYAEMAEAATRLDVADGRTALASMHYLAYLAEMVRSKNPYNDGRKL